MRNLKRLFVLVFLLLTLSAHPFASKPIRISTTELLDREASLPARLSLRLAHLR
jgi:hypothetical protein